MRTSSCVICLPVIAAVVFSSCQWIQLLFLSSIAFSLYAFFKYHISFIFPCWAESPYFFCISSISSHFYCGHISFAFFAFLCSLALVCVFFGIVRYVCVIVFFSLNTGFHRSALSFCIRLEFTLSFSNNGIFNLSLQLVILISMKFYVLILISFFCKVSVSYLFLYQCLQVSVGLIFYDLSIFSVFFSRSIISGICFYEFNRISEALSSYDIIYLIPFIRSGFSAGAFQVYSVKH